MLKRILLFLLLFFITNLNGALLIDDFNDGNNQTYQNQNIGNFDGDGGTGSISADSLNALGNEGYCYRLTYAGCNSGSANAGIVINLDTSVSYSNYHYLSFYIKGDSDAVGDSIAIGYEDPEKHFVNVADYLPKGITTEWQKAVIPLDGINTNFYNPQQLIFNARGEFSSGSGTIYIDNVTLGTNIPGRLIIDAFSDNTDGNSIFGNNTYQTEEGYRYVHSYTYDNTEYNSNQNSLRLDFELTNGYIVYEIQIYDEATKTNNCSIYSNLTFYAKQNSDHGNFTNLKVEFWSPVYSDIEIISEGYRLNNNWQKITLPLKNFNSGPIINSEFKKIKFTILPTFGSTNATLYLDDIALETKNYSPDISAPSGPSNVKANNNALTHYYIFDPDVGVTFTADTPSIIDDGSLESIRFEYRQFGSSDWTYIEEKFFVTNTSCTSSQWFAPLNKIFDFRVSAIDIYGNIGSSTIYINCNTGNLFKTSEVIDNATGGWLRNGDFAYVSIPSGSLDRSSLSFTLSQSANGQTIKSMADNSGSPITFYGNGLHISPDNYFYKKKITIQLPIPSLPESVSSDDLTIYYWDNGSWIDLGATKTTDEYGNNMLQALFDRTGIYIIGIKSELINQDLNITEEIQNFYMSEKVMTPNNDGYNDIITFSFNTKLNDSESILYKIIHISGRIIAEEMIQPTNHKVLFSWDGNDSNNKRVKAGIYIIYIKAGDKKIKSSLTVIR